MAARRVHSSQATSQTEWRRERRTTFYSAMLAWVEPISDYSVSFLMLLNEHPHHNCHFQVSLSLLSQSIVWPPPPLLHFLSRHWLKWTVCVDESARAVGVRYKTARGGVNKKVKKRAEWTLRKEKIQRRWECPHTQTLQVGWVHLFCSTYTFVSLILFELAQGESERGYITVCWVI